MAQTRVVALHPVCLLCTQHDTCGRLPEPPQDKVATLLGMCHYLRFCPPDTLDVRFWRRGWQEDISPASPFGYGAQRAVFSVG
jgi:hypothetical protein